MNYQQTQARLPLRLVVAFTSVSLAAFGLATPIQAATSVPTTSSASTELIDSLVVKYEPGAAVVDKAGNPNGESAVTENVDLKVGRDLGRGYRTITLAKPVQMSVAQQIAAQLGNSQSIELASPNYKFKFDENFAVSSSVTIQNIDSGSYWGLDRIDQGTISLDRTYAYASSGSGVTAYVIDSGINPNHAEFITNGQSRVLPGYNFYPGGNASIDCDGHGTSVASIIGGNTTGVAKNVKLVPMVVSDCTGSGELSLITQAINKVIELNPTGHGPAVVNISRGCHPTVSGGICADSLLESAINDLIAHNIAVTLASGNENIDACRVAPASAVNAFTVNASNSLDRKSSFSNWGTCTDIFAPGENIAAAFPFRFAPDGITVTSTVSNTTLAIGDGTSLAAPFVAGAIANILSESPTLTPAQIWVMLAAEANRSIPADGLGSPTLLLHQPADGWTSSTKASVALQRFSEQQAAIQIAAAAQAAADAAAAELASRTVKLKSRTSVKTLARQVGFTFSKKATVSFTVPRSYKRVCTVSGGKLRAIKAGECLVSIKIQEPKPRKGKRPPATKDSKVFLIR